MVSLVYTRSAAAYKNYPTLNKCMQPELWTKMVNARPIIDRVTRPLLPSVVPNDEGSRVYAADGWIDEGWEYVTGKLLNLSG